MVFHLNLLEKAYFFHASQFWQMENALSFDVVIPTLIGQPIGHRTFILARQLKHATL